VRGLGRDAAHPHRARDPIVVAALLSHQFQTIITREVQAGKFGLITVGAIHGGVKHNAIPDEVHLQVNIRYFEPSVRDLVLASIRRICEYTARSHGIPEDRLPVITFQPESVPPLENDPSLTAKVIPVLAECLGKERLCRMAPLTGSEDFGVFGLVEPPLPLCNFRVWCADETGSCGFLHSSRFSPPPAVIRDATRALVIAAMEILPRKTP